MPWVLAASITSVPAVVVTCLPSIVNAICLRSAITVPIPFPCDRRLLADAEERSFDFAQDDGKTYARTYPNTNRNLLLARCLDHVGGLVGALAVEMILELIAPFLDDADRGQRGRVAERAEGAPENVLRKLGDQRNVFLAAGTCVEPVEHFLEPGGAFAAGNAPAAGFMRVEMHDATSDVHHAGVFVHDHGAA